MEVILSIDKLENKQHTTLTILQLYNFLTLTLTLTLNLTLNLTLTPPVSLDFFNVNASQAYFAPSNFTEASTYLGIVRTECRSISIAYNYNTKK